MSKKIIIIVLLVLITIFFVIFKNSKFSLETKYYNNGKIIQITSDEYNELVNKKESFILFVHLPGVCLVNLPFAPIVEEFVNETNITVYSLNFKEIDNTNLNEIIKYSPSVLLLNNGKVKEYLDPNKESDLIYYKDQNEFQEWVNMYINMN